MNNDFYNSRKNVRSGITLVTLFTMLWFFICVAASLGVVYVLIHFICKLW